MNRRPTTQDVTWLLDLFKNGQLDLNPPYQRRSVWTRKDRQFFLDTVFRNFPSPAIFLHKEIIADKTIYHVVDGKQRLQTILDFVAGTLRISQDFGDVRLAGKKWTDLQGETTLKHMLWNYQISVEFLDVIEGDLVNAVFDRLNRNSRKLTPQELRHARFEGWFIATAEAEAKAEEWKTLGLVTPARATRMADTQFISELMLVALEDRILGFDQDALDEFYGKYDDPDNEESPVEGFSEETFRATFSAAEHYVLNMQEANGCITAYTRQFYSFYTLWCVIVLERASRGTPLEVAKKYAAFMEMVERLAKEADVPALLAAEAEYTNAYNYYTNSRGANTDLQQRTERYQSLKRALLG